MADDHAREKLLNILDKKAFDPVLHASSDDYSGDEKKKLADVQAKTKSTKRRYHTDYTSAKDVVINYKRDLDSEAAQKVDTELRDLQLPTLGDIKGEFEKEAKEQGVWS